MAAMEPDESDELERIREELKARDDAWYVEFDRSRKDSRVRYEDLVARHEHLIAEFEELRGDQRYRFDKIDMDMERTRRVTRETLLEVREGREDVDDARDALRASVEGLMRILDELRRGEGPSPAGA
jgi:hypothetical protein